MFIILFQVCPHLYWFKIHWGVFLTMTMPNKSPKVWSWRWSACGAEHSGLKGKSQEWFPTSSSGQGYIWSLALERLNMIQKNYKDLFERKNSQLSQNRTCVASSSPPLSCPSMNKEQPTILTGFGQAMSSDIKKSNDAQLEMASVDFFHCENIDDWVVKSTRFKYMLKQVWLVGGEFRPPQRKNWR